MPATAGRGPHGAVLLYGGRHGRRRIRRGRTKWVIRNDGNRRHFMGHVVVLVHLILVAARRRLEGLIRGTRARQHFFWHAAEVVSEDGLRT